MIAHLEPLPPEFYNRSTLDVAHDLPGHILFHHTKDGMVAGRIVEVEAYGPDDPANHAYKGKTFRNAAMFGPPGTAYIYKIYGIYWCFNAVTAPTNVGEAVLIRALEPVEGLEIMRSNRKGVNERLLCSGPGRLCQAMGIVGSANGHTLNTEPLWIGGESLSNREIIMKPRIGISRAIDLEWRFYLANSPYISRK